MKKSVSLDCAVLSEQKVLFKVSAFRIILTRIKTRLFQLLTRDALPLFVRGADIISTSPQIQGVHEPQVKATLDFFAQLGFDNFLLDVGANIGLTSCQSAIKFKKTHMFEPNPLCIGVLRTNAAIALAECDYEIHEYGLGVRDESLSLRVPKNNWGGAHINTEQNAYSLETLAAKDGFTHYDAKNYLSVDIMIKRADLVFDVLFQHLEQSGLKCGAVKIDIEGLELVVLDAISRSLPAGLSLMVIFESWGNGFNPMTVTELFGARASLYSLAKTPAGVKGRFGKLLALLIAGSQRYTLKDWSPDDEANDLILHVKALDATC